MQYNHVQDHSDLNQLFAEISQKTTTLQAFRQMIASTNCDFKVQIELNVYDEKLDCYKSMYFNLTQDNFPFNLETEVVTLIDDSIDHLQNFAKHVNALKK